MRIFLQQMLFSVVELPEALGELLDWRVGKLLAPHSVVGSGDLLIHSSLEYLAANRSHGLVGVPGHGDGEVEGMSAAQTVSIIDLVRHDQKVVCRIPEGGVSQLVDLEVRLVEEAQHGHIGVERVQVGDVVAVVVEDSAVGLDPPLHALRGDVLPVQEPLQTPHPSHGLGVTGQAEHDRGDHVSEVVVHEVRVPAGSRLFLPKLAHLEYPPHSCKHSGLQSAVQVGVDQHQSVEVVHRVEPAKHQLRSRREAEVVHQPHQILGLLQRVRTAFEDVVLGESVQVRKAAGWTGEVAPDGAVFDHNLEAEVETVCLLQIDQSRDCGAFQVAQHAISDGLEALQLGQCGLAERDVDLVHLCQVVVVLRQKSSHVRHLQTPEPVLAGRHELPRPEEDGAGA